jgi:hypothetical protein
MFHLKCFYIYLAKTSVTHSNTQAILTPVLPETQNIKHQNTHIKIQTNVNVVFLFVSYSCCVCDVVFMSCLCSCTVMGGKHKNFEDWMNIEL